jgi:hypothetical protein
VKGTTPPSQGYYTKTGAGLCGVYRWIKKIPAGVVVNLHLQKTRMFSHHYICDPFGKANPNKHRYNSFRESIMSSFVH